MKIYDEFNHGVLHVTKCGLVRITHDDKKLNVPRGDELIVSIQPTYGKDVDVQIRTKLGKRFRTNFTILDIENSMRPGWLHIKRIGPGDEIESAGTVGRSVTLAYDDLRLEEAVVSVAKEIDLVHVAASSGEQKGIRFIRLCFVAEIPELNTSLLSSDFIGRLPSLLHEPDVAILHAEYLKRAMIADGVTKEEMAHDLGILEHQATQFVNCTFTDLSSPAFHRFMRWIVDHGYTLQHIMVRHDAAAVIKNEIRPAREKKYSKENKERVKSISYLCLTKLHWTGNRLAKESRIDHNVVHRILNFPKTDSVSDQQWFKMEKFLKKLGLI